MAHAFLDESGDDIPFGGQPYLVVALLSTGQPRALDVDRQSTAANRGAESGFGRDEG
ncbi:MAG: hypothetical protein IPM84_03390 [Anaerolineae bacterium]|nr:hypothetical protein [Anaerolineae bacterium]